MNVRIRTGDRRHEEPTHWYREKNQLPDPKDTPIDAARAKAMGVLKSIRITEAS